MNEIKFIQGARSNTKTGEMECIKTNKTTSDRNRKCVFVQEIWNHGPHKNRPQSAEIEQAESSEGKKKKYMNEITLGNERV